VCRLVVAARDLVDAVDSGDLERTDVVARAQDLQQEFALLEESDGALQDEIKSIIGALSDMALPGRIQEARAGVDFALDDLACPGAAPEPTETL
jgi:hypothetical protein